MKNLISLLTFCCIFFLTVPISPAREGSKQTSSQKLSILTSFSPDFYQPFIEEYQKHNPTFQIQVLNKKTTAAIAEIQRGNSRNFDIFWSSSPDAFAILKDAGKLVQTGYLPAYPPINTTNPLPGDNGDYFFNFALSGVGYMWNKNSLSNENIKPPNSWKDLTDSRFYGQLAISTPSRSGTTHLIVESLLQQLGWQEGWKYLLKTAANLETITARSFSVPDGVASKRFSAGLVIDFLATAKMNMQNEIDFSYGKEVFLMPAGVAALENGKNINQAVKFIDFLLSIDGQSILLRPSINRMPISRAVFDQTGRELPPLMDYIQKNKTRRFNTALSQGRYLLVNTLFDQVITFKLLEYRRIWKKLITLEKQYGLEQVQKTGIRQAITDLLCEIPVSEEKSLDTAYTMLFQTSNLKEVRDKKRLEMKNWDSTINRRISKAEELLEKISFQLSEVGHGS